MVILLSNYLEHPYQILVYSKLPSAILGSSLVNEAILARYCCHYRFFLRAKALGIYKWVFPLPFVWRRPSNRLCRFLNTRLKLSVLLSAAFWYFCWRKCHLAAKRWTLLEGEADWTVWGCSIISLYNSFLHDWRSLHRDFFDIKRKLFIDVTYISIVKSYMLRNRLCSLCVQKFIKRPR